MFKKVTVYNSSLLLQLERAPRQTGNKVVHYNNLSRSFCFLNIKLCKTKFHQDFEERRQEFSVAHPRYFSPLLQ